MDDLSQSATDIETDPAQSGSLDFSAQADAAPDFSSQADPADQAAKNFSVGMFAPGPVIGSVFRGLNEAGKTLREDITAPLSNDTLLGMPAGQAERVLKIGGDVFGIVTDPIAEAFKSSSAGTGLTQAYQIAGLNQDQARAASSGFFDQLANAPFAAEGAGILGGAENAARATALRAKQIFSPKVVDALKETGAYKDIAEGQASVLQAFDEGVVRPTIAETLRNASPELPEQLATARALGVIGEGDGGYFGTEVPTDEQLGARAQASAVAEPIPAPEPPDIHETARQIAPEVFGGPDGYDELVNRQNTYRRWIDELDEKRRADAQASPEAAQLQAKIDDLRGKVGGRENELTKAQAARLANAQSQLEDLLNPTGDDANMAQVRRDILKNDYRMRDLAPKVSAAYREAESQIGGVPRETNETVGPVQQVPTGAAEPGPAVGQEVPRSVSEGVAAGSNPNVETGAQVAQEVPGSAARPVEVPRGTPIDIEKDAAAKLIAAGRPADEAQATAALIKAHYDTRAARFDGKRGTGADLYARDFPEIRAGLTPAERQLELAQKGRELEQQAKGKIALRDSRNIIILFKNADASTAIHEIGHQWLEELLADAAHEAASADVKADATTVRNWLGTEGDAPIKRAQHEKFARGFERYMMEGVAPTKELGTVFAKFKNWLTKIYQTVTRLRSPINDDIRDVFDRLLTTSPERTVVAPEVEPASGFADIHEADAETTAPENAKPVADNIQAERDRAAEQIKDEALKNDYSRAGGPQNEAGTSPSGDSSQSGAAGGSESARPGTGEEPGTVGPGGNQTAAESAKPQYIRAFRPVPKEPMSLIDFIKSKGGIADDVYGKYLNTVRGRATAERKGSDLRAIGAHEVPGLIRPKAGRPIDEIGEALAEAGYFPELGGGRPDINQVVEAIRDEIAGTKRYSDFESAAVDKYNEAIAENAETQRLADTLGISLEGKTRAQFLDEIAERMSVEEQGKWVDTHADDIESGLDDLAGRIEAEVGDAWEGEKTEYDTHRLRTLEDLENEAEQSRGAAQSGAKPSDAVSADVAPKQIGPTEPHSENGTVGSDAGEFGPTAGEGSGTAAGQQSERARSELAEKAGNIRLDNLNQPEDVDDALRQIARQQDDFASDRFGPEGRELHDTIKSARILAAKAMQEMAEARTAAALDTATDADLLAYQESSNRLTMIARRLATLTHAWGYAGQAFRMLEGLPDMGSATTMAQLAERTKDMTLFQLRKEAQLGQKLDTQAKQLKYLTDVRDLPSHRAQAMIIELFVNNLISGPVTHTAYSIGNMTAALFKVGIETPFQAAISTLTGAEAGEKVYIGEVKAQVFGIVQGAIDGWDAARRAWKTGIAEPLPGELDALFPGLQAPQKRVGAIPGKAGEIIRLPSDAVAAIHSFGRLVGYTQELYRRGYRAASDMGLDGDAHAQAMADYIAKPPAQDIREATEEATNMVLMRRPTYGSSFQKFQSWVNSNTAAKLVMPFMQVGVNLLREGFVERTPLGLFEQRIRDNVMGKNGTVAQTIQLGKIAAGSTLATAVVGLTLNGTVSGGGPSDPKSQQLMRATGWQPYSIKIGNTWIPYRKYLGYLGPLVAGVADMAEIADHADGMDITKFVRAAGFGFSEVVADESWFSGASNFISAARNFDKPEAERYVRNLATSFIPFSVGLSQTARMIDPYAREIRSLTDAIKAKIPGMSEQLLPRRDLFGEPIASRSQITPSTQIADPAITVLHNINEKLGVAPSAPARDIRGVKLTDQQYDDYSRIAGRLFHVGMSKLVNSPGFANQTPEAQRAMIFDRKGVLSQTREAAQKQVIAMSVGKPDDIMRQAIAKLKVKRGIK